MKDKKFYERVKPALLLTLQNGNAQTIDEYLEAAKETHENTVYYATDRALQAQYISMLESQGISVVIFERPIEAQFATMLEQYRENVKFLRVDAEIADALKGDGEISDNEALKALFQKACNNEKLTVKLDVLKDASVPTLLNISEESRRMEDMMRMYGMSQDTAFPTESTLILNTASPLIAKIAELLQTDEAKASAMASYLYKVALLSQKKLSAEEMQSFLRDSNELLMML
jgi:molecular chaperone HtpG